MTSRLINFYKTAKHFLSYEIIKVNQRLLFLSLSLSLPILPHFIPLSLFCPSTYFSSSLYYLFLFTYEINLSLYLYFSFFCTLLALFFLNFFLFIFLFLTLCLSPFHSSFSLLGPELSCQYLIVYINSISFFSFSLNI